MVSRLRCEAADALGPARGMDICPPVGRQVTLCGITMAGAGRSVSFRGEKTALFRSRQKRGDVGLRISPALLSEFLDGAAA